MYTSKEPAKKSYGLLGSMVELAGLLLVVFLIRTFGFGLYHVPTCSMETTMLVGERFFADKFSYRLRKPARNEIIALNDPSYQYSDNPVQYLFQQYAWGPVNWTKRVIGTPGDTVRGTIENGKAIVYVNDKKLDEPYINKYPLIRTLNYDRDYVIDQLRRGTSRAASAPLESPKSFDPELPFDKQPFYRIHPDRVITDEEGRPGIIYPDNVRYFDEGVRSITPRNSKNYYNGTDEFYIELGNDEYWLMGDNRRGSHDSRALGPVSVQSIHARILFRVWSVDTNESWVILDLLKHPIDFWSRIRFNRFFQWIS